MHGLHISSPEYISAFLPCPAQEAARDVATATKEVASTAAGRPPAVVHVRETPSVTQVPVGDRVVERPVARQAERPPITSVEAADALAAQQAAAGAAKAEAEVERRQQQLQQYEQQAAAAAHQLPLPSVHTAAHRIHRGEAYPQAEVQPRTTAPQQQHPPPALPQEPRGPQLQLQFRPPPQQPQPQQERYEAPPQFVSPPPQPPMAPGERSYLSQAQGQTHTAGGGGATGAAPPVTDRARAAGAVVSEHAKAAAGDVRRAGSEAGAVLSTHGELAKRDVATAAGEVKQSLTGDRLPGAVTVRQTPPLLEQPWRDVAARVPTGVAPEASAGGGGALGGAAAAGREPTTGERIREAAAIIKEHAKVRANRGGG